MHDETPYRTIRPLSITELGMLHRMATYYSELVREHAHLVGLMSDAALTGDAHLLASTKRQLAQNELECDRCFSELRVLRQELLSSSADEVGLRAVA